MEIEIDVLLRLRNAIKAKNKSEVALVLRLVRETCSSFAECGDEELQKKLLFILGKKLQAS